MPIGRARREPPDYRWSRFARRGDKVEKMMRQIALICAALGFGVLGSPASAQQTPSEQTTPPAQQTGSNQPASPTEQSTPQQAQPPSSPQTEPLPPPFPPMPRARPSHRWVDLGEPRKHRHPAPTHRHQAKANRHEAKASRHQAHPSSKMTRRCLDMTLRQAMRRPVCRSLMQPEHHPSAHRHHPSARKHNATHQRQRHQSKRRRT